MIEKKVKIITDAGSDLPQGNFGNLSLADITQIPLSVTFGQEHFVIGKDIDNDSFRRIVLESHDTPNIPKTSAVSFIFFWDEYDKSNKDVLSIHLGSNLSSTFEHAKQAISVYKGNKQIDLFDTGTASMAQGIMAIKAEELAQQGKNIDEIKNEITSLKTRVSLRALAPNIPYLRASGRVSHLKGILAERFHLNPILQIDNHKVEKIATPRHLNKGIVWLAKYAKQNSPLENVIINHFDNYATGYELKQKIIKMTHLSEDLVYLGELGPVTASHGGPGTIAMTIVRKK